MLTFDDYSLQEFNQYVDITFTSPVYGISNDETWDLGWPMDNNDYFEFFTEENGQPIQTGTVTQVNGQPLVENPYPGYTELRFPLLNPPADGSTIFLAPKEYNFENSAGATAPHPVNLSGVPFNYHFEMEIELNELSTPEIDSIFSISAENDTFSVEFSEGIYSGSDGTGGVRNFHFEIETVGANLSPSITLIMNADTTATPQGAEDDSLLVFNLEYGSLSSGSEFVRIRANEDVVYNFSGIAMETEWSNSLQLNDLLSPYVAEYSFSNETNSGVDPASEIIIEFDNPVRFQDGSAFTPVTIATLCSLYYVNELGIPEGEPIPFDATGDIGGATEINSIIITPTDSLTEQSQVLVIIAGNVIVDTSGNIMSEEKNTTFTVADVTPPKITSYSLAPNNDYVLLTFSEDIWSETNQSGSINTTDFEITLNSDDENSNASEATLEQVADTLDNTCLLYTSPSPRDATLSRMPSSA